MARAKKLGATATAMTERQFIGPEPIWEGLSTEGQLKDYYNWCNYRFEYSVAKTSLINYLKANNRPIDGFQSIPDYEFMTVGWTARLLLNGQAWIDEEAMGRFNAKIEYLYTRIGIARDEPRKTTIKYADKISPGLELCEQMFDVILNTKEFDEDVFVTYKARGIDSKVAEAYLPTLNKAIEEMDMATSGKHPEITEGYANYKTETLRGLAYCMSEYRDALGVLVKTEEPKEKKVRAARIKRPKPAEKQVKKLKYAKTDDKYKITSIDPRKVVGASEVWLFNVVYRKLTVLRAIDRGGFTIKGSTIYGFDEKNSGTKRVRKPEVVLKEIIDGGKVSARRSFEALKTDHVTAKGRVNEDVVILRVF